jgi:NodT family efflux transporter outer membrane factor (OMF) lipoprotein
MAARAMVREAKAGYFPTVSVTPSATAQHGAATSAYATGNTFSLPADVSWAPDLWGRIRNQVSAAQATVQASAADLENERLTEQAALAMYYYELRGQDALQKVLDESVKAQKESLELTQNLYKTGIGAEAAVAQADAQLQTTEAQAIDVGVNRALYEHAIAVLIGQPASSFSIAVADDGLPNPPGIPFGVPSQLLERRPDIAAAERTMAAANAQIGVAVAAFYPSLTLTGSAGFVSTALGSLFSAPSFLWSLGASLQQLVFDGGLRQATVDQYKATYDQDVALYRQAVLTAFQQVEDQLSTLRILANELGQEERAVKASEKSFAIELQRYKLGIDPYLDVLTAQLTLLGNQQTDVGLQTRQLVSSVELIEALGGGWVEVPSQ